MRSEDFAQLLEDTEHEILSGGGRVAILGLMPVTLKLLEQLRRSGLISAVKAVHASKDPGTVTLDVPIKPVEDLIGTRYDVIVVASDARKEDLLLDALDYTNGTPKVVIAGYAHFTFHDDLYAEEQAQLLVPSIANGYPNSLVHIYQCLSNAARLQLTGSVVEFGMFKGDTTVFMARVARRLGQAWPVIGFDTFAGFPQRRSPLDMYSHPGCVFTDLDAVRRYTSPFNIRIVDGDIVETAQAIANDDIVLSFIDTDNYTSVQAALDVVQEQTVVGGAIVFDHFTGVDRFRYTLGERLAGRRLVDDPRYFNLHGTGVFFRQR